MAALLLHTNLNQPQASRPGLRRLSLPLTAPPPHCTTRLSAAGAAHFSVCCAPLLSSRAAEWPAKHLPNSTHRGVPRTAAPATCLTLQLPTSPAPAAGRCWMADGGLLVSQEARPSQLTPRMNATVSAGVESQWRCPDHGYCIPLLIRRRHEGRLDRGGYSAGRECWHLSHCCLPPPAMGRRSVDLQPHRATGGWHRGWKTCRTLVAAARSAVGAAHKGQGGRRFRCMHWGGLCGA